MRRYRPSWLCASDDDDDYHYDDDDDDGDGYDVDYHNEPKRLN